MSKTFGVANAEQPVKSSEVKRFPAVTPEDLPFELDSTRLYSNAEVSQAITNEHGVTLAESTIKKKKTVEHKRSREPLYGFFPVGSGKWARVKE